MRFQEHTSFTLDLKVDSKQVPVRKRVGTHLGPSHTLPPKTSIFFRGLLMIDDSSFVLEGEKRYRIMIDGASSIPT